MRVKWTGENVKEMDDLLQKIHEGTEGVSFVLDNDVHVVGNTGKQIAKVGDSVMVPPAGYAIVQHHRPDDNRRDEAEKLLGIIFDEMASDSDVSRAKSKLVEIVCPEVLRVEGIAWPHDEGMAELPAITEAQANAPREVGYGKP